MKLEIYYAVDLIEGDEVTCYGTYDTEETANTFLFLKLLDVPKGRIRMVEKINDEIVYDEVISELSSEVWSRL